MSLVGVSNPQLEDAVPHGRLLKWIAERLEGAAEAEDTAIGRVPTRTALDLGGLGLTASQLDTLLLVDHDVWREEAALIPEFFSKFAGRLPEELWRQHRALEARLSSAPMRTETAQGATPPR